MPNFTIRVRTKALIMRGVVHDTRTSTLPKHTQYEPAYFTASEAANDVIYMSRIKLAREIVRKDRWRRHRPGS